MTAEPAHEFTAFTVTDHVQWAETIAVRTGGQLAVVWTTPPPGDHVWTVAAVYRHRRHARRAAKPHIHLEHHNHRWLITATAQHPDHTLAVTTACTQLLRRYRCITDLNTYGATPGQHIPTPHTAITLATWGT